MSRRVIALFEPAGTHLQARRCAAGHVAVADDLAAWRWKDEDGLAWMMERGLYSPEKAESIRAPRPWPEWQFGASNGASKFGAFSG
jgi:hypothetical protein